MASFETGLRGIGLRALRRAWRTKYLVLVLWGAHLALAAVAAFPVLRQLNAKLAHAPAGDEFLERISLPLLADLSRGGGDWSRVLGLLLGLVALFTLIWNALAAGGTLECLLSRDPARLAHRFGRGAGRFFGRFLRMGLAATPTALLAAALLSGPVFAVAGALDDTAEGAKYWLGLGGAAVALFAILCVLLALDVARVRVARDDSRRSVRVFFATLRAVLARPWPALALWAFLALAFGGMLALYLVLRHVLPMTGAGAVFVVFVAQQVVMIARSGMRVALWSGEIALVERRWPEAPLGERLAAGNAAPSPPPA